MEFIAFPVKKGDSFLLQDKNFNLLVDGGDGKVSIMKEIVEHTNHLDVIICTHYDEDHIKGLLDFIEKMICVKCIIAEDFLSGLDTPAIVQRFNVKVKEIWLPDIFARIQLYKEKKIRKSGVPWMKKKKR